MKKEIKKELFRLFRANRIELFIVVVLMLIAGFVQAASIIGLMPIVDYVIGNDLEQASKVTQTIVAFLEGHGIVANVYTLGGLCLFIVVIKGLLTLSQKYYYVRVHLKIMNQVIYEEYQSIVNSSWKFLGTRKYGTLANTIIRETEKAGIVIESISNITAATITCCFYVGLLLFISWKLTAIVLFISALSTIPVFKLGGRVKETREVHRDAYNALQGYVYDALNALKLIIGFNKREDTIKELKPTVKKIAWSGAMFNLFLFISNMIGEPLGIFLILVTAVVGTGMFSLGLSEVVAFMYAVKNVASQVQTIVFYRNSFKGTEPSIEQIFALKIEADDYKEQKGDRLVVRMDKGIELRGASFSYCGKKDILTEINMFVPKGKMVALVGPSGAGKSTLIDLMMGFQRCTEGTILVDNYSLDEIDTDSFRDIIGYVPQSPYLFNTSLYDNLKWAKPDATQAEVVRACELANATEFIDELDKQYDTVLGERGVRLSGGQAQRICLARAIIRKPQILILDEATCALDSHSELMIQKSIDYLSSHTTILVIAHRLATIKKADYIYQLESGRVVEEGTFVQLMQMENGIFKESAKLQGITI
jgi:ABC-type multidrug transport system fused ATPase/permease subunit